MTWRIYSCRECFEILGVGDTFPDNGVAKHEDPEAGWIHADSVLYETPDEPPLKKGGQAVLDWASDHIENGTATEIPQ